VKNDPCELPKKDREAADERIRNWAKQNPDWVPCDSLHLRCACVDSLGKSMKLFLSEHDALQVCSWLNTYRPEQPPQVPYECPETKHWQKMN
jgi:hypothetical protein